MTARGGAREKNGRWYANVRFGKDERLELRVPFAKSETDALERAAVMAGIADELVACGRRDLVRSVCRRIAEAASSGRLATVVRAAKAIVAGAVQAGHAADITIKQWGERYTSGDL